jgi:HKD family nuclease
MNCIYLKTKDDSLKDVLVDAVKQAKKRFWCVAPFVTADGLSLIIDEMKPRIDYRLITRLDTGDMFFGSLDLDIIIKFIQNIGNNGKVRFHNECLHSKLWISDNKVFIGSANLTRNALEKNNELMVMAHNEQFFEECRPIEWFEDLWNKLADSEKTIEELEKISQEVQSKKNIFEKIKRQMPKFEDYGKSPVVTIEELHRKFWEQLLNHAKDKGVMLHKNVNPSDDSWLSTGAGKSGLNFSYVILLNRAKAELTIETSDKERNKAIFDELKSKKKQIESKFGTVLEWDRKRDKIKRCTINHIINRGGLDDQNKWVEIQDAMIGAMDRLSKAFKPHIQALDK